MIPKPGNISRRWQQLVKILYFGMLENNYKKT
jgi:hypothetical protein